MYRKCICINKIVFSCKQILGSYTWFTLTYKTEKKNLLSFPRRKNIIGNNIRPLLSTTASQGPQGGEIKNNCNTNEKLMEIYMVLVQLCASFISHDNVGMRDEPTVSGLHT